MTVRVDHNYPEADALVLVDTEGTPIAGANIKVYALVQFNAGITDTWVADTTTDMDGKWVDPLHLEEAQTWVVYFDKPSMFAPAHVEITT